tara:strand:- start:562 stop:729 length:168 start_codon:yes stop_codon:yes gene_type:complete
MATRALLIRDLLLLKIEKAKTRIKKDIKYFVISIPDSTTLKALKIDNNAIIKKSR